MDKDSFNGISRIAICGDWHGNGAFADRQIRRAKSEGAELVIHVGDFGLHFDVDERFPESFTNPLNRVLEETDLDLVWIDGNHDNHGWINSLPIRADGFVQTGLRTFYSPRGHRWIMGGDARGDAGLSFGTLGGAFSINRDSLVEGRDYFQNLENIRRGDVVNLGYEKLDVLLTHEVSENVPVREQFPIPPLYEMISNRNRYLVRRAIENTRPDDVFSGHWHQCLDHDLKLDKDFTTRYHVLSNEYTNGNMMIYNMISKTTEKVRGTASWLEG